MNKKNNPQDGLTEQNSETYVSSLYDSPVCCDGQHCCGLAFISKVEGSVRSMILS